MKATNNPVHGAVAARHVAWWSSAIVLGALALLLGQDSRAAQGKEDGVTAKPQAKSAAKPAPKAKVEDAKRAMHHAPMAAHAAMGQKAKGSGIVLDAVSPPSMGVGQATRVTLRFHGAHTESAIATIQAQEGVTVTRLDGSPVGAVALSMGRPTQLDVMVSASGDGLQYLHVTTEQDGRASVRSVPLKVGSGAVKLKANGTLVTMPNGEQIVSMPAK